MHYNHFFEKMKNHVDKAKIISFDIFDTLLLRPYIRPTDVFTHIELMENADGFAKARTAAESEARKSHPDKEDINTDEIYNEISDTYKALKNKELDWESKTLQPNMEIKQIFDYAKSLGKRIVIISDMYLSTDFLKKVLIEKGYTGFEKLYVSSDVKKTKWTGNLYKYACEDLGVAAHDILHIGDNKQSDFMMAQKAGLRAFHYKKPFEQLLENDTRANAFYELYSHNLGASILLGCLSLYHVNKNGNYWHDFGFKYGGPVVYGYMQWLAQQLKKDKITEALFVARDGYS